MSTHTPTGFNWSEALQPQRRGERGNEVEAMASLAAWCDSDRDVLAQARADVLVDTHGAGGRSWCRTSDRCGVKH
jgi:hypothetical protein